MKRAAALNLLAILILATASRAQDNKSLGDVAREARAAKSSSPKSASVVTNDDVPSGKGQAAIASGNLSPDKQAFCEELRRRKDTAAEQGCALLGIDMGPEYEDLTARYVELSKTLCGADGGSGLPGSEPKNAALAAQWREENALATKFMQMLQTEMKSMSDRDTPYATLQQEENDLIAKDVPDIRDPAALAANPKEKERFREIEDKYKPLIAAAELPHQQTRLRLQRYILDQARMERVCSHTL